ncbi:MAG TPA: sigma-70 family RNA polymerase sigma factor [Myxococcales bacterium]
MSDEQRELVRLYEELGPVVYRRCLRLLADREAARDATQEVFVKVLQHPERSKDPVAAVPFVFAVATNHCLNHLRDGRRQALKLQAEAREPAPAPAAPAEPLLQGALGGQLFEGVDDTTRAIVEGVFGRDLERQEVAAELGVSRKTVTRKLERFFERARELLGGGEP